jgi:hypothetical protein
MVQPIGDRGRNRAILITGEGASTMPLVPRRRRPKSPKPQTQDPVAQFAAILKASAEREQAERDRLRLEQQEARDAELAAAEHAAALDEARRELEHAITGVREARRAGSGVAAADETWRHAKARLIELETGAPPEWARHDEPDAGEVNSNDGDSS